jgi:hypothetical protein
MRLVRLLTLPDLRDKFGLRNCLNRYACPCRQATRTIVIVPIGS